jgi:hypothetical protein
LHQVGDYLISTWHNFAFSSSLDVSLLFYMFLFLASAS